MDIPQGPADIIRQLRSHGYEAWAVGGCVRDSLLGRTPHDWDLCTSALPQEIKKTFEGFLPTKDTGIAHGTITVFSSTGPVEVTTFRLDGHYTDHRRPDSVVLGVPLEKDLVRRDFTINAMAGDDEGHLVDLFGGQKDLEQKLIRCVGEPHQRFTEDALRILRALRFASQLDFEVEANTMKAARACAHLLARVSRERVFFELDALLLGPGAGRVLAESGEILAKVIPAIGPTLDFDLRSPAHNRDLWKHTAAAVDFAAADRQVRWALLLHDLAKPDCFVLDAKGIGHAPEHGQLGGQLAEQILRGLHAPNRLIGPVKLLVRFHDFPSPAKEGSARRWMARLGPELLDRLILVKRADLMAHAERPEIARRQKQLDDFEAIVRETAKKHPCLRLQDLAVDGNDLIRAGLTKPGPKTGRLLYQLLYQVIDGAVENKPPELMELAAKLAEQI